MEVGQSSGSNKLSNDLEVWAKLVPSDSKFPEFEIRLNETIVCSDITSDSGKRVWCQITRNSDLCSAKIKNQSSSVILVDGAMVNNGDVVSIRCGSEIVPSSVGRGHLKYKFEVMPVDSAGERRLKISLDVEHAKCSICLNVWHDVVTVAPCLHNFCNGCLSEWLKRSQKKSTCTLCPQCRGVVQFVGRNHFLHNIEEDILKSDASLRRPKDELDVLDSSALRAREEAAAAAAMKEEPVHAEGAGVQYGGGDTWQDRLLTELGGITQSIEGLFEQMDRIELQIGGLEQWFQPAETERARWNAYAETCFDTLDQQLEVARQEQARYTAYADDCFTYATDQWKHFYSQYPPPGPSQ